MDMKIPATGWRRPLEVTIEEQLARKSSPRLKSPPRSSAIQRRATRTSPILARRYGSDFSIVQSNLFPIS
jgi:hypothetical protein